MDLTPPSSGLVYGDSGDRNLMALVEEAITQMSDYASQEFGGGRRRGYFEPGGVMGPIRKKSRSMLMVDNMVGRGSTTLTKKKMAVMKRKPKRKTVSLSKKIHSVALRAAEIKNYNSGSTIAMTHNTVYGVGVTQGVVQGTDGKTRVGDEIFMNSFRAQVLLAAPTTAGAYTYRVVLLWSGEEYSSTSLTSTTLAFGEIFLPNVFSGTNVGGVVNRKAATVIYDQVVCINSNVAATADVVQFPINVSLKNVKFPYQSTGSIYGKHKNLYCVIIPFVVGGTSGTTSCGNATVNLSLDYKDL